MVNETTIDLGIIFEEIHQTILKHTVLDKTEFEKEYGKYKYYENRVLSDNDYFNILVDIIFYSGFKASTVNKYIDNIHKHFPSYLIVQNYNQDDIDQIMKDSNIIKNERKMWACVNNAKKVDEIIRRYGSIQEYINYFEPSKNQASLAKFKKSIETQFDFIGGITSYHFMTDIGLNVIKPDRVIMRLLTRLGLVDSDKALDQAIEIGRTMSKLSGYPIRYIDLILVLYGQLNQKGITSICTESNPKCHLCGVKSYCNYFIQKPQLTESLIQSKSK